MEIRFYNTMSRKTEIFEPIEPMKVKMYACGPTVYNYAHIGNLRTYIFEDLLKRLFLHAGYEVNHVMNITDVGHLTGDNDDGEDKMVKSSRESSRTVREIADFYTNAFFNDTDRLHILRPTTACKATDHIDDMIALIQTLEKKGFTYEAGGNIYFSIDRFPEYGRLARLDSQQLQAGARVAVDGNKRNPHDFVLWFTRSKYENHVLLWDSPWGKGYPGWHIECSAMSMKYLGPHFDIHCGGIDHIPVHHTNEIAQSEAASGEKWVDYWLHGEFLILDKGKMSKSSGSFLTLQSLIDAGYDPLDYRWFCLGAHYRSQLTFSFDGLKAAASARRKLFTRTAALKAECAGAAVETPEGKAHSDRFWRAAADDLNLPKALASVWALLKDETVSPSGKLAALYSMDEILGLGLREAAEAADPPSVSAEEKARIEELLAQRREAKAARDFARADEIRDRLAAEGIRIRDTAETTLWEKIGGGM